MPTYEYECSKCKEHFEMFQGIKDDPVKSCPKCGGKVYRLIGMGGGIIFKGSGFYQTDYKNRTQGKAEGAMGKNKKGAKDNKSCPGADNKGCEGCSLSRGKDG